MSQEHSTKLSYMVYGAVTSGGVGSFIFQGFGVLVLGVIGALGGWLFTEYLRPVLKPKLDRIFKRK